jgi:predicted phosphodiesterase
VKRDAKGRFSSRQKEKARTTSSRENTQSSQDTEKKLKIPASLSGPDVLPGVLEVPIDSLDALGDVRILVVPDIHFPIHDAKALDLLVRRKQDWTPDITVFLGDVLDCKALSSWKQSADTLNSIEFQLAAEIEAANPYLRELSSFESYWIEGNHEARRRRLIDSNPGLAGLQSLEPREFFNIPEGIRFIERGNRLKIGNCYFEHGDKILNSAKGSRHVAHAMHSRRPLSNTFTGHWHCVDQYTSVAYKPSGPEAFMTATLGHLSDHAAHDYVNLPNWVKGFGEITMWKSNGKIRFSFDQVNIIDNSFVRERKLYE